MNKHKESSLADKVIRNSLYLMLQQAVTFLFPLILTPLIVSFTGKEQFGIYALVLGFVTVFGLFDLSISSSFVVFFSRHIERKDDLNLNRYFNTGLFFYIVFSLLICLAGYLLADRLLSLLSIPAELSGVASDVYHMGLVVFFVNSVFSIYSSVLISLQRMYVTSLAAIAGGVVSFVLTIVFLYSGYGLPGLMFALLASVLTVSAISFAAVRKHMPSIHIRPDQVRREAAREMISFGSQMQLSKLAGFASEKYDEFLLAHFTALGNVTYFNIASRISRTGRLLPFQIIPQVAPVAANLKARDENEKLSALFSRTSKYLLLASVPVFAFLLIFSDLIIKTWMGPGFEDSYVILKILCAGQLVNLAISAPGNSIIPNTGFPRIQMYEGIINLVLNIVISFLLIREFGILGAAAGSAVSTAISSGYVFVRSSGFFGEKISGLFSRIYLRPVLASMIAGFFCWIVFYLFGGQQGIDGRFEGILMIGFLGALFCVLFAAILLKSGYLDKSDKILIAKAIMKVVPSEGMGRQQPTAGYENELVSLFIVTHNRLGMLKKCIESLLPTLSKINHELIIVDNASADGTAEYLSQTVPGNSSIRVITNTTNKGTNAKSQGAVECKGDFMIGIDDDVISFPDGWVEKMISAYKTIPRMGYLATDVVVDETTTGGKHDDASYRRQDFGNGITLLAGPTGGWCFMLSRDVYNDAGPLITFDDRIFFVEDDDYVNRLINKGYRYGILEGVKVYHAAGDYHNREYKKVFESKYADYKKGFPSGYKLRRRIADITSFRRHLMRIELLSKETFRWS